MLWYAQHFWHDSSYIRCLSLELLQLHWQPKVFLAVLEVLLPQWMPHRSHSASFWHWAAGALVFHGREKSWYRVSQILHITHSSVQEEVPSHCPDVNTLEHSTVHAFIFHDLCCKLLLCYEGFWLPKLMVYKRCCMSFLTQKIRFYLWLNFFENFAVVHRWSVFNSLKIQG